MLTVSITLGGVVASDMTEEETIVVATLLGEAATSPGWATSGVIESSVLSDATETAAVLGEGDWLLGDAERGEVWTKSCRGSSITSPDGSSLVSWLENPPFDTGWEGTPC